LLAQFAPLPEVNTMSSPQNVVIFAATGAVSTGVARAFAAAGATLWLSGRSRERTEAIARPLRQEGARVFCAEVDATDAAAVASYLDRVQAEAGSLDVVFNGIGGVPSELAYPKRTLDASVEDFLLPIQRIAGSQFLTSREAGRRMVPQQRGAIVTFSATLSVMTAAHMAGLAAACGAIEAMTRALAGDFGPAGVRVNCVRGSAMPETRTIQQTFAGQAAILGAPPAMTPPPLGRPITVAESAAAVVFLASPGASGITGQVLTVCAGQFVG
jgi:NAD(P)-dependent dehydrogenase (short-subunit alcohol dehydrogenase family)